MELEETSGEFKPQPDPRVRMPEPLPVRLVSVDDVRLIAPAGSEQRLDALYVGILGFEPAHPAAAAAAAGPDEIAYRADNFSLRFTLRDRPIERESMRPQGIDVQSLADVERMLLEAEWEYIRQRGTTPGWETLLLLDPGGNWIEISETRTVM